jgi:hypothetical protein
LMVVRISTSSFIGRSPGEACIQRQCHGYADDEADEDGPTREQRGAPAGSLNSRVDRTSE